MGTKFVNFKNSKTSDPHRLLLNLTDKINFDKKLIYVALSILAFTIYGKIQKSHIRTLKLKFRLEHGVKNLNYLMNHNVYQIFKIILNLYKKHRGKTVNPSIRIYINKIENRITFKIKIEYYLKLLMPETMKLLGSNKSNIAKHGENVPKFEITEVVLAHWNIACQ